MASRSRVICGRVLVRLGFGDEAFLILLAAGIGVITALAAVGFHELIQTLSHRLYTEPGEELLYGKGMWLLIFLPALGGLVVGFTMRLLGQGAESHGVIDVMESVIRTRGFVKPRVAAEKIFTSGVTIGTGGSAGAEGPIVQIGAAIAGGVGSLFAIARHQMPVLIGCGSAAGISAIFNAPIGGLLFTLEIILLDFSLRTVTPLVVASVIANVTTRGLNAFLGHNYEPIFSNPFIKDTYPALSWMQVPSFLVLGVVCGLMGVLLTKAMHVSEGLWSKLRFLGMFRPAAGGAMLGVLGVAFVLILGRGLLDKTKPFPFHSYSMPAFYGDGYGIIKELLQTDSYGQPAPPAALLDVNAAGGSDVPVTRGDDAFGPASTTTTSRMLLLLACLCGLKILATAVTLGSGGSGGVIAPSLLIGASAGGCVGLLLRQFGLFGVDDPSLHALIGMGAVLGAVVHAPLAAILILVELTESPLVTLPAMLGTVTALGVARLFDRDSLYTAGLRRRGVRVGHASDPSLLRRMTVEQVSLEPASVLQPDDPFQRAVELSTQLETQNFVVIDEKGQYVGMIFSEDLNIALLQKEAIPLMIVGEIMRTNVPAVHTVDDLATVFDHFARFEVSHLPVTLGEHDGKVIGLISRAALMRRYTQATQD